MIDTMLNQMKTAFITGGSSGIGKACAEQFAIQGYQTIITARRQVEGEQTVKEIEDVGGKCEFISADLSKPSEIHRLFDIVSTKYQTIDCAVNNAGMEGKSFTKIKEYPEDVWDDVLNLNLKSIWLCMKYEITKMLEQPLGGSIVNVSSTAGLRASLTGGCAYTASKHGLIGLSKTAAVEYASNNIRVNVACPAIVDTPMARQVLGDKLASAGNIHPLKRLCSPQEVAEAIYWLCSEKSSFITGIAMPIDGGITA